MILLFVIIGVLGAIYVSLGKPLNANYLFFISNLGLIIYNYRINELEMMVMFFIYLIISLVGIINLTGVKK